ncbi:hypothetical protein [Roseibium aggregatum]|uniref:Uncharacterized protein n=1 Tax=Roseibium aggregatum TaxID=187304 RepID=A0A926SAQ6_9HYPH|nr:hypothetical protein [Roseibium aggregatum]MBD1549699.1 hypothetical protein [Roseibium aggregatum]
MAAIGNNYAKRHAAPTLKEINKAWSNQRRKSIQKSQNIRSQFSSSIFTTNVLVSQRQTVSAIKGAYSSMASAMARVNILV